MDKQSIMNSSFNIQSPYIGFTERPEVDVNFVFNFVVRGLQLILNEVAAVGA